MSLLFLMSLAGQSPLPEPPKPVAPVTELSPPDYSAVCETRQLSGTIEFSVGGKGGDRILSFKSVEGDLVPSEARVVESVRLSNVWVQERLELGDSQSRLFGSVQWNVGESVGRLQIWEPMVGYYPMKIVVAGKCELAFGDKL